MSYGTAYGNATSEEPEYGEKAYDEEAALDDGKSDPRASNFPWWCFPKARCFYHNIGREVKDKKMRPIVYREYITWYLAFIAYFTNLVAESWRYHKRAVIGAHTGVDLGIAIALLTLVYPATLFIYMLLYGAARDVGKSWTWWWLLMGLQMIAELIFTIGVPATGSAGLVAMIKVFEKKTAPKSIGFACLAVFLMFLALFIAHFVNYIILWRYRSALESGHISKKTNATTGETTSIKAEAKKTKKKDTKKNTKKKDTKKTKQDKQPLMDDDQANTYQPPEPTTASSSGAYASPHDANDPAPAWHQPTGSAYDKPTGSAYDKPSKSSAPSGGANPFGDEGGLDDFYS